MEEEQHKQEAGRIWDETEPYAKKVKFELNKPVLILFPNDFEKPKEMPGTKEGESGYCMFEVKSGKDLDDSVIMTSSVTMLRNLKTHMPLAGKSIMITKKNVGEKSFYYVEDSDQFNTRNNASPEPDATHTNDIGLESDGTMK